MIKISVLGFHYSTSKGFSLAWLLAFTKSFALLVSSCLSVAWLPLYLRDRQWFVAWVCNFLPIRAVYISYTKLIIHTAVALFLFPRSASN